MHAGSWQTRLMQRAKAEPRKTAVLVALLAVLAIVCARSLSGGGPARAPAATVAPAHAAPAVVNVGPLHAASEAMAAWLGKPIPPVSRNLFAVKLDYFPQDASTLDTLREPRGDGFWDELAKSMTARADLETRRRILIEQLRLQARALDLQTTMTSQDRPKALVNGTLVGEGDVVAGFRLVKIEARRIIVEREGIKLEILNR